MVTEACINGKYKRTHTCICPAQTDSNRSHPSQGDVAEIVKDKDGEDVKTESGESNATDQNAQAEAGIVLRIANSDCVMYSS